MVTPNPGPGLLGRSSERALLDLPVSAVRAGESQALFDQLGFLLWSFDGCDRTLHPRAQRESDDSICDSLVAALEWLGRRA